MRDEREKELLLLIREGLRAADPAEAVKRYVRVAGDKIIVRDRVLLGERVHVIGFGKASHGMLMGLTEALGGKIAGGAVIHGGEPCVLGNVKVLRGDHPLPGENTASSSRYLMDYISSNVKDDDVTFVLISGGGSAMFEVPEEGVSIEGIATVTRLLLNRGADIYELNSVRKSLSSVKGGKLLTYLRGTVVSLIISDVVGDSPSVIASGPTVISEEGDPCLAINIVKKRGAWSGLPDDVATFLSVSCERRERGEYMPRKVLAREAINIVIASNYDSLRRIKEKASELGYKPLLLTAHLRGEAREVGKALASIIKTICSHGEPASPPLALIAGGETTVTVRGKGMGGRNQELCLSLSIELRDLDRDFAGICFASDGIDGSSPAAGALIFRGLYESARMRGIEPEEYLYDNDSYGFFERLGLSVKTGQTGTNVNDFVVILIR